MTNAMIMARWANGVYLTKEEAIEVLMWYFGTDADDAELILFAITLEKLQVAVNYYIENHESMRRM